jgi:hypothetical protein
MLQFFILGSIGAAAIALACRKPAALIIFLILVGPYYGFTKHMFAPDSLLVAWKDVVLAGLLAGLFLRLHGRLKCPVVLTILLIYCGISACIPGDWQIGMLGFRATCQWMLLAVATSSLRDPSLVKKAGNALIWSGTVAATIYIIERTSFHNQDQIAAAMGIQTEDRARYAMVLDRFSLIYGNPNALAVFLVICACFAFAWYLSERSGRARIVPMLCGAVCVAGVLSTASRGALAALLVAVMVVGHKGSKKVRRMVLAGALASSVFVVQPDLLTQRLQETSSDKFYTSYRYQVWTGTIERALSSPQLFIVGSGLGTFGGYVSDASGISDVITENQFFKILGEQGLLGLFLMFAVIWRLRMPGLEARCNGSVAVPAAIAAVLTYCLLGNILDGLVVSVPFWTIVGLRLGEPWRQTQYCGAYAWARSGRAPQIVTSSS